MKQDLPPLNWLRSFEAASRHLSFTHAASELGLTQVAVSKQIKQLEEHLNERLFIRHARSLELTKAAEAWLPKVRDGFARLSDGTREVFGKKRNRMLTIRAAVGFSTNWLAPRLADFRALYPEIPLRIISSVWNEQTPSFDFDFDIRYGTGKWPGMRCDRLTWETIMPVCDPSLVRSGALGSLADLAAMTLVHVLGYEEGWAKWLHEAGADNVDIGKQLQVDTSLLAFEFVRQPNVVAMARSSLVRRDIDSGRLMCPFDLKVAIEEAFYLVSRAGALDHPEAGTFRQWLLEQIEDHQQCVA